MGDWDAASASWDLGKGLPLALDIQLACVAQFEVSITYDLRPQLGLLTRQGWAGSVSLGQVPRPSGF